MSKRIEITDEIRERMKLVFGDNINFEDYVVFDARAISTESISKEGTIFDKAVPTVKFLNECFNFVSNPSENIGIHLMHNDYELNIGRVFDVKLKQESTGVTAMYVRFAMLKSDKEAEQAITKIEGGLLDEVSIGFSASSGKCSVCGFDFFDNDLSEDEKYELIFSQECPEGHKLGKDGCHLVLDGCKKFSEISIVNRGAAHRAKIQKEAVLSETLENNIKSVKLEDIEHVCLTTVLENKKMTQEEFEIALAEKQAEIDALTAKLEGLETKSEDLEEEPKKEDDVDETPSENKEPELDLKESDEGKDQEIDELKGKVAELTENLNAVSLELKEARDVFIDEVNKTLVAADKSKLSESATLKDVLSALSDARLTLAASIPTDGKAVSAVRNNKKNTGLIYGYTEAQLNSFKENNN